MTDQTPAPVPDGAPAGSGDDAQERLPATIPQETLPAERFTAPPAIRATAGLTPQRSAGIVRQSASARWIGFLTVDTGTITLGPLPIAVGQPGIEPPRSPTGCI